MKFEIVPKVPEYPRLAVHIELDTTYQLVKDAFCLALPNLGFELAETTRGEYKERRFEVIERGLLAPYISVFRTAVTFYDVPAGGTRVVVENRKPDGHWGNGMRGLVGQVVDAFCKVCVAQGVDMTGAEMARLLLDLEPHLKFQA